MTVNELIEQLKNLPKEVRERPIMDGNPNEENIEELENRYDMSMHVEHRALAFFN